MTGQAITQKTRTAQEVLDHHVRVLADGLVDEVVDDYAPDAVILTSDGAVRGHEEITRFFANSVANVLPPSSAQVMLHKAVEGELAFIIWSAESPFYSFPFGTDTFIIRDGLIRQQTFAGVMVKKESK